MKARDIRPPGLQAGPNSAQPILEAPGMSTHFPGVQAVCDLDLYGGEVHLNAGENGAGKSTLMKLVAQLEKPEAHEVRIDGNPRAEPHANTLVAEILDQLGETFGTRRAAPERKTVMAVPSGVATASGTPDTSAATSLSTPPSSSQGRTQTADAVLSAIAGPAAREITGVHALAGGTALAFAAVRERIPEVSRNAGGGVVVEAGEKRRRSAVAKAPVVGFDQMRSLR
jgi:ABC-type branched-subunit amino acid transport system ATPase component